MTHEESARVLKESFFYHVTLRDNMASIKEPGAFGLEHVYGVAQAPGCLLVHVCGIV